MDEHEERLRRLEGQARSALLMGVFGMMACGQISPFAMWKGHVVNRELQELGLPPNPKATVGFVVGLIWTIMLVIGLVVMIVRWVG